MAALHPKRIDLSLGRVERLLDRLGRPQDALSRVVHVAGTNGKGSTIAFLRAFAEAAGQRVHVYTSPHLVRFTERVTVAGREIDDETLIAALERVERANAGAPITFFEITTAAALSAFAETPADLALIEVGLGGRYDATNVFAAPACAVITPVGLDHQEFLGDTLEAIAHEKAGILKPGAPAVIGPQAPAARAAIAAEGLALGARLQMWGADFRAYRENGRLVHESATRLLDLPAPSLLGEHQIANAGTAIAAALALGDISQAAIARGLKTAHWPGRLQRLTDGPLAALAAAADGVVYLDGAHNAMGAAALARALADLDEVDPRPLALVLGMQRNKDLDEFLAAFEGLARGVIGAPVASAANAWTPAEIRETARARGFFADAAASLEDAVAATFTWRDDDGASPRVVVTGSLYLVGEALALGAGRSRRATAG